MPDYSDKLLLVFANGKEVEAQISDISLESHEESVIIVRLNEKKKRNLYIFVDSSDGEQYINLDLLFAAVNPHTRAMLLKG